MGVSAPDYRRACQKAGELVDPVTLLEAIEKVYQLWAKDKILQEPINFHSYFGLSMFDLGVYDMFEHEQYRKALATYFQPRALAKLTSLRQLEKRPPANRVSFANTKKVEIRINRDVSLLFRATSKSGRLSWKDVVEDYTTFHFGYVEIDDKARHSARKQALQVLNSKRGFRH